jgi:hypothetical protein
MAEAWLSASLDGDWEARVERGPDYYDNVEAYLEADETSRDLAFGNFKAVRGQVGSALEAHGLHYPEDDDSWRLLAAVMLEAKSRYIDGLYQRQKGGIVEASAVTAHAQAAAPAQNSTTLKQLTEAYRADREREHGKESTDRKYGHLFRVLEELLGPDTAIATISRASCRSVRDFLERVPSNSSKKYPGMTLGEAAEAGARDGVELNATGDPGTAHFWLHCEWPWSNRSLGGRLLAVADLPGGATSTAGFRGTVCEPRGWETILRVIRDDEDPDATRASEARQAYEAALVPLVARLHPKDFELLVELILARTGWTRLAKIGGATEGVDVEVENATSGEIAFVQVKSAASQAVLDDYVARFAERRERYARMIFAVHSPRGKLKAPPEVPVQVWEGARISQLVVALGLGDWVARRL